MPRSVVFSCVLSLLLGCAGTSAVIEPAPPPDPDEDRVSQPIDLCPTEAEDRDGHADDDGCPEADDDGDGILDADDRCPGKPEDVDRYQDADGCPDPDNDGDRILDADDLCPCVPELFNGHEDEDGCPDRGPILLIDETIRILEKVYFARGSAAITAQYEPILQAVAATLVAHAFLERVEIAGHTSGDERRGRELSEARASAVRDALIAAGVTPERLVVVGHASTRPLAPGRSRDANEHNRRVEFDILVSSQAAPAGQSMPEPIPDCPEP